MRKLTRIAWLLMALLLALSGCTQSVNQPEEDQIDEKTVYTSFFPFYALAKGVFDGVPNMNLICLVQPQDGCLRNYQLSEWDMARIASADAMIIGGRGMESFESALLSLGEDGPALMSALDAQTLEGQAGASEVSGEIESHITGANPWLFLSVDGASEITEAIAAGMITLDPSFEELYAHNLVERQRKLEALQQQMSAALIGSDVRPVALMHEGLIYLAQELGLLVAARIDREPGSELYDNELQLALDELGGSGASVILLEKQAPRALKQALTDAGYSLALIDTFSTFPRDTASDYYDRVMLGNAEAVAAAFGKLN